MSVAEKINEAWMEEGSFRRQGMIPASHPEVQAALIPAGGDWKCIAREGAVTRTVMWRQIEVALVLELIAEMAAAAINYVEQPAPALQIGDDE